jgi:tetratricopeptide (TPR) repeat protein
MMAKSGLLIIALLLVLSLSGCLTWETEEIRIKLDSLSSGMVEIRVGSIGSNNEKIEGRLQDLGELIYGVQQNASFGEHGFKRAEVNIEPSEGELNAVITLRFDRIDSIHEAFEISVREGLLTYIPKHGETILETNGKIMDTGEGGKEITWPYAPGELYIKKGFSLPMWKEEYSLFPEYQEYLKNTGRVVSIYSSHKINEAGELLKEKKYRKSYDAYRTVLRAAPKNKEALKGVSRLGFVRYYDYAEAIPLPNIDISFGVNFKLSDFDRDNFIDIAGEIKVLEDRLTVVDNIEKSYLNCRLCKLYSKKEGADSISAMRYRRDALNLFRGINIDTLKPEAIICYGDLLVYEKKQDKAGQGFEKAAALYLSAIARLSSPVLAGQGFKEAASLYSLYWQSYERLYTIFSLLKSPGTAERLSLWIKKGDDMIDKRLERSNEISADEAYQIFSLLFSRNIAILKLKNISMESQNPVTEQMYRLMEHAVMLEPDNPIYRSMLGSLQLWMFSYNIYSSLDYSYERADAAVLNAIAKVKEKMGGLIPEAKKNLSFVHERHPDRFPFLYRNLAFLSIIEGEMDRADEYYRKSISLDKEEGDSGYIMLTAFYATFFARKGIIFQDKREILKGLLYEKAVGIPFPYSVMTITDRFILGKLELQDKNYDSAYRQFSLCINKDPSHYPCAVGYYKSWLLRSPTEAKAIAADMEKLKIEDPAVMLLYVRGMAYAFAGERKKALSKLSLLTSANMPGLESIIEILKGEKK